MSTFLLALLLVFLFIRHFLFYQTFLFISNYFLKFISNLKSLLDYLIELKSSRSSTLYKLDKFLTILYRSAPKS